MDPYEQYLADAEYEDYLKQARQEQAPQVPQAEIGPDYNQSIAGNAWKGITDTPSALLHMGKDIYNFASPYNTESGWQIPIVDPIRRAGPETTARITGGLASGVAGAASLAPFGAGWGSVLGPLGTLGGGALGAGAGFAGGILGFDLASDAGTAVTEDMANYAMGAPSQESGYIRPTSQYAKDFAYNASQGTLLSGTAHGVFGVPQGPNTAPPGSPPSPAYPRVPGLVNLPGMLAEPFTQAGAERRVAERLDTLQPGYADQVNNSLASKGLDPFLEYKSLGELIDSDVLKNAQRTIAMSAPAEGTTGTPYGRAAEANRVRNTAQLKYLDELEQTSITPEDVQNSIRRGVEQKVSDAQFEVGKAEEIVGDAVNELRLPIDKIEAGSEIREGALTGKDALRGEMTAAFEGAGRGVVDPSPVQAVITEQMPRYFKEVGAQPNGELVNLISDINGEPIVPLDPTQMMLAEARGEVPPGPRVFTLQDTQALRSKALKIAGSSDKRVAAIAGKIAEALKFSEDAAVQSGKVSPIELENLNRGRALRKEIGTDYESSATPTKQVLAKQPHGEFKVPESAVPSKYFRPGERGTREGVQNYKKVVGETEAALEPLYRYATDSFRDYVVKDGKVDAGKARKWLARHASALEELPDLRRQLSNVDTAQTFLNEKFGDLKRTQAEVEKGALKQFLQVDPEKAIPAMLSGKDMVKRTIRTVQYLKQSDPDAVAGLRRGVIDHLKQKAFSLAEAETALAEGSQYTGDVLRGTFAREWNRIRPALERSNLFTESQIRGFDYLYKDIRSAASVPKAKIPGDSGTAQNLSTLGYLVKAARNNFLRGVLPGPTKYLASIIEPLLKSIPEAKFQSVLEQALLNPRYARDLMNKATAKNVARSAEAIFKDELGVAFGGGRGGGGEGGGGAPLVTPEPDKKKPPSQQQVTSKKSFPGPTELLQPPAKGSLKKISFDVEGYLAQQSPETRARVATESAGDPFAVSPKGAQGLSQLMPATAQDIASDLGETYIPLRPGMSPEQQAASIDQNVRFGDYYYQKQLKRFKNTTLAWAAYNAGPQRVEEAIAMAGTSRDINKILSNLPKGVQKETIPYVNKIAERYGKA